MATRPVNLPPGFQLETPSKQQPTNLPPGFVMEEQPSPVAAPPQPTPPGAVYRAVDSYGSAIGAPKQVGDFVSGPVQVAKHPIDSAGLLKNAAAQSQQDLIDKAYTLQNSPGIGNKLKGFAYGLYSAIPFAGPTLAHAGEQFGTGDIAGGLGSTAGVASTLFANPEARATVAKPVNAVRTATASGLRTTAEGMMNRTLGTRASDFNLGKNPGGALLDENIVAATKPSLAGKISSKLGQRTAQLETTLTTPEASAKRIDVEPAIRKPFQKIASDAEAAGAPTDLLNRLRTTEQEMTQNRKLGLNGYEPSGPKNMNLSPLEATQLKRGVGKQIRWNNQPFDFEVNAGRRQVYGGLKDAINDAVPEAKPLNDRISNLVTAQGSIDRTLGRTAGHNAISVGDMAAGAAGATMGENPLAGGITAAVTRRVLGSPAIQTPAAQLFDFAANRIKPKQSITPVSPQPYQLSGIAATKGSAPSPTSSPASNLFSPAEEGQGGHAGNGVASIEEINRPGKNYVIGKNNQVTYHGKAFAPESTGEGAVHVTVLPDGNVRVNNGSLTEGQEAALRRALKP